MIKQLFSTGAIAESHQVKSYVVHDSSLSLLTVILKDKEYCYSFCKCCQSIASNFITQQFQKLSSLKLFIASPGWKEAHLIDLAGIEAELFKP